jgi:hypothetical protein
VTRLNAFVHQVLRAYRMGHVPMLNGALRYNKRNKPMDEMTNVNLYWIHGGHFIPQHHYCFEQQQDGEDNNKTVQIVKHILKLETLRFQSTHARLWDARCHVD